MTAFAAVERLRYLGPAAPSASATDVSKFASGALSRLQTFVRTATGQRLHVQPLGALAEEVAVANQAAAIGEANVPSAAALREAHTFLDSLPDSILRPVPLVEPSGAIAFEWDFAPNRYLILAVKGTGVLEFSAATGAGRRTWGVTNFTGGLDDATLRMLLEVGAIEGR